MKRQLINITPQISNEIRYGYGLAARNAAGAGRQHDHCIARDVSAAGKSGVNDFLVGAFVVLFSTMVTVSTSNARLLADGLILFTVIPKPKDEEKARAAIVQMLHC